MGVVGGGDGDYPQINHLSPLQGQALQEGGLDTGGWLTIVDTDADWTELLMIW